MSADSDIANMIGGMVLVTVGVPLYFLPSIVGKHKRNATAIFVLNLLTGWTVISWIIAVVWACAAKPPSLFISAIRRRIALPLPHMQKAGGLAQRRFERS